MPATARVKERAPETLPLEERIRRRAYELYVQRGNESGSELKDWLQAEEEIRRANDEAVDDWSCDNILVRAGSGETGSSDDKRARLRPQLKRTRIARHYPVPCNNARRWS